MPESAADRVRHSAHGKDFGYATRSAGDRKLGQPGTRTDGKPVTESNLSLCVPARKAVVIWAACVWSMMIG